MSRRCCSSARWNQLLAYETARKTVIQHWIVGLIHFVFLGAVALYIFGYVMFWNQRYLKRYPVTGDFRYKLIPPKEENKRPIEELKYCRKYLENAFEQHEDKKFVLNDGDPNYPNGTHIEDAKTLERCKKACVRSEKSCIGFNFQKMETKCYHIFPSESKNTHNIVDAIDHGFMRIEPNSDWTCIQKVKGKEFLFHENVGNCAEGIRERENTNYHDLSSPKPGQHSGSFGIFLGYSNKNDTNCECGTEDHEDCYSNNYIFFPNIEKYELEVTHGYVTMEDLKRLPNDDRFSKGSRELRGRLVDQDGNVIQDFNSSGTGTQTRDRIKIEDILRAAEIKSFDEPCDGHDDDCSPNKPDHLSHSFRNEGLVVYLRIEYLDDWYRNMEYTYRFDRMEDTDWSIYRNKEGVSGLKVSRQYLALRIPVIITGSVGEFDFMNMIVEFTSSLFLLGMADLFMVYIVFKCFPQKELYQRAVYQKTKTFEHVGEMKERKVSMWEDDHNEMVQIELTTRLSHKEESEDASGEQNQPNSGFRRFSSLFGFGQAEKESRTEVGV